MKLFTRISVLCLFALAVVAQRPWQQVTIPTLREAAANFKTPPRE